MGQKNKYIYVLYRQYFEDSDIYGIFHDLKKLYDYYNELLECYKKKKYGPDIVILKLPIDHFIGEKFVCNNEFMGEYFSNSDYYRLNEKEINQLFKEYY